MKVIYMDNAATSFPKPKAVVNEIKKCIKNYCANPGRSSHYMAIKSSQAVMNTRIKLAEMFNAPNPMNVIFTANATHALNYVIKGIIKTGQHVITTCMEHNSVLRPLNFLKTKSDIEFDIVKCDERGVLDPQDIKNEIKGNTSLIVCTYSSNVNGIILPVNEIGRIANENGIKFLLDASQGAGCFNINMEEIKADFIVMPGHKGLMGPQGTGVLIVRDATQIDTIVEGGTGSVSASMYQPDVLPDKFESGTLNVPGIVGLGAGIDYINNVGMDNIQLHKMHICAALIGGLSSIKGVQLYSYNAHNNSGIVGMNIRNMDSSEVSGLLNDKFGIATRPGLHCAPEAHKALCTIDTGIVRISPGWFNTNTEVEKVLHAVELIVRKKI